ncbi:MAG: hypothetical protein P8Z30_18930, partial [Acidobacteriota bacterium]
MEAERRHIVFIDDSTDELETFERLYSGDRFKVTTILVQRPSDTLHRVYDRLNGEVPNLFVLDLFFPQDDDIPAGLGSDAAREARAQITRIVDAASGLPRHFSDGNRLLKEAHGVVAESQHLLSQFCQELRQSPEGGIRVLKELNREYASVPKVFYSRKATIPDAKKAMMAGGLDVLLKPHPSIEDREAPTLMEDFAR